MVAVGDEIVLLYMEQAIDPPYRRCVVVLRKYDDGDFDVRDLDTGDVWTVFLSEWRAGLVRVEGSDPDDAIFAALTADLDIDDDMEVADFSSMNRIQLMDEMIRVKQILADSGHLFVQDTEEEKDLRTRYDAIMMEIRKREAKEGR